MTWQGKPYLLCIKFRLKESVILLENAGISTRVKIDENINMYQRISALKLAKECNEAIFKLIEEGPSVMYLKQLQEKA